MMAESIVALCCSSVTMRMSDVVLDHRCDASTEYQLRWESKLSWQSQTSPLEGTLLGQEARVATGHQIKLDLERSGTIGSG
jgi:hypothetical protein